jgi:hypothetical protein
VESYDRKAFDKLNKNFSHWKKIVDGFVGGSCFFLKKTDFNFVTITLNVCDLVEELAKDKMLSF